MKSHEGTTEYDAAHDSPGYLLWLMSNKWQARQRAALRAFNLTHVQFVLLACLTYARDGESLTQVQLAERAQADPMMTSQVVRRLEADGLVRRKSSQHDKRAFELQATKKGIELVYQAIQVVEGVDQDFFGALAAERPSFVNMMRKLVYSPQKTLNTKKDEI